MPESCFLSTERRAFRASKSRRSQALRHRATGIYSFRSGNRLEKALRHIEHTGISSVQRLVRAQRQYNIREVFRYQVSRRDMQDLRTEFYRRSQRHCDMQNHRICNRRRELFTIYDRRICRIAKMQTAEYAPRICNHGICRLSICRLAEYTKSPFMRGLLAVSLRSSCGLVKALIHIDTLSTP